MEQPVEQSRLPFGDPFQGLIGHDLWLGSTHVRAAGGAGRVAACGFAAPGCAADRV